MKHLLSQIGNIPATSSVIASLYPNINGRNQKISQLERAGEIIRLKRGLFVVSPDENFDFSSYFQPIIDAFTLVGRKVEIRKKDTHLRERIRLFNGEELNFTEFKNKLKKHLATTDIGQVKADVLPFVRNPKELDIWSNDYFLQLVEMMNVKE